MRRLITLFSAAPLQTLKNDDDEETDFIGFSPIKPQENTKGEQINEVDIAQADAIAKQLHVYKPGITFVPGAKLEVLDSRDNNWYQCRVVEVDWGELDILVHYERWSVRYDEWLKMDSTRIRPLYLSKDKMKLLNFKVGEKVLGFWAPDSKYYLGQITKQSSEDYFEVLFYDGYTKTLRTSQLKKTNAKQYTGIDLKSSPKQLRQVPLSSGSLLIPTPGDASAALDSPKTRRKSVPVLPFESPPASPKPQVVKEEADEAQEEEPSSIKRNIFDVEILEKKRKTKRKPDVEQLFKSMKKKRKISELHEFERRISSGKASSAHRARTKIESKSEPPIEEEPPTSLSKPVEALAFPTGEGMPGKRCNYLEVDLGHGWRKVCTRRTQGIWMGKWDVYFITSEGKKLRSRLELTKYCEDHPGPLKPSDLDFSVRSAKQMYDATKTKSDAQIKQEILSDEEVEAKPSMSKTLVAQSVDDDGDLEEEDFEDDGDDMMASSSSSDSDASADSEPKVPPKDVVKKRQTSSSESETEAEVSSERQDVPSVKLSQILSETLKVEESPQAETKFSGVSTKDLSSPLTPQATGEMKKLPPRSSKAPKKEPVLSSSECPSKSEHSHKCPSRLCEKSFRKENLLQMHMKHYHPELLKRRSLQAPNVADLAYARTVGDHLDVASPSPSSVPYPTPDFALPEKKTEAGKKPKSLEVKKASDKKGKKSKDNKREKEDESDSDEGTNDPEELSAELKEEEAEAVTGKVDSTCRVEPDPAPKVKLPRRFQRERTVSRSETTKRRSRKSESMSEDDPTEKKPFKVRSSKQPTLESVDPEEDNAETWTEAPADDYQDAIIHCGCNSQEEDGLMLQCDVCLTWQHGNCYSIESEDQVPEKYICFLCENPKGQRPSMRFRHHQEWLKEGKLPRFSFSTSEPNVKLESCIRRGHELSANVLQLSQLVYSLRLKLNISKEADHPKFVMWHKKWEEPSDDKESQSLDPKWTQNVSENQLSPIQDLISSLSQPSSQQDPQVTYSLQDKTTSSTFGSYSSSSALLNTRSEAIDPPFQLPETENSPLVIEKVKTSQGGSSEGNSSEALSSEVVPHEGLHPSAPKPKATEIKVETAEILPKPNPELPVEENSKDVTRKEEIDLIIKSSTKNLSKEGDQLDPPIQEGFTKDDIPKEGNEISKPPINEVSNKESFPEVIKKGEEDRPEAGGESTSKMKDDKAKKDPYVEKNEDIAKSVDASSHDSLDDPEDLDLALGALGEGADTSINDGLVDLLSSHPEFEQLVDGSELAPLVPNSLNVPPAPIIPKYERIEPANCKLNLLKHVEVLQDKTTKRFDYIENQLKALEAEMDLSSEISREEEELLASDGVEGRDAVTLQARALVKLILNDLDIVKQMADFSDTYS